MGVLETERLLLEPWSEYRRAEFAILATGPSVIRLGPLRLGSCRMARECGGRCMQRASAKAWMSMQASMATPVGATRVGAGSRS
jgi:hypothetical protein